ncbi:MAG: hypothetical protein K2U26_20390 [Cyclobacteriaceae bacterium]|nr:hypothetical protein [Cyclobacteriaceae bacterium]
MRLWSIFIYWIISQGIALGQVNQSVQPQKVSDLQESVLVHTDKDFYYAGEKIWFKVYLQSKLPGLIDSLSRVIYVDLIKPSGSILASQKLQIIGAAAWGDIALPLSLPRGMYRLRVYTQWMRNFGENNLFEQYIPVLSDEEVPVTNNNLRDEGDKLQISSSKEIYTFRDQITLELLLLKEEAANLSIAVTDAKASPSINSTIQQIEYVTEEKDTLSKNSIRFPLEYGLTVTGTVLDSRGRPAERNMLVVEGQYKNMKVHSSNFSGRFTISNLSPEDSIRLWIRPLNKKGMDNTIIKLDSIKSPFANKIFDSIPFATKKEFFTERLKNNYQFSDSMRMLDEVVIRGKKEAEILIKKFGLRGYPIKGEDIRGKNVIEALSKKVSGARYAEFYNEALMRMEYFIHEPGSYARIPIIVDFAAWPQEALMALNPEDIDKVEVSAIPKVVFVFTKFDQYKRERNKQYYFQLPGYSKSSSFYSPDYQGKDKGRTRLDSRTTIYWNPSLQISQGQIKVSFYSGDLATNYRIVVKGITESGTPFQGESFIQIKK